MFVRVKGRAIAAAGAVAVTIEDVIVAIGAGAPEVGIGDVEDDAVIVAPAPGLPIASRRAAVLLPIAVRASGNGIKLV